MASVTCIRGVRFVVTDNMQALIGNEIEHSALPEAVNGPTSCNSIDVM